MSAASEVIEKIGGTTEEGDSVFIQEFNLACKALGLNKNDPALASLAYSLYLSGIIITQKINLATTRSEYAGLLAKLDATKLPKS